MANISTIKVGSTSYGITATPKAHASTATTYGAASASNYGHVKLSDNYTSSAGAAASGIGASSAAVYNAYNTLNSKLTNIPYTTLAQTKGTSNYTMKDTGYSVKNGICFVYFGVFVITPSNGWMEVLSGLPKPLKASEFCISARADSDVRRSLVVYKDSGGGVLKVALGTANASYYNTISYPVA